MDGSLLSVAASATTNPFMPAPSVGRLWTYHLISVVGGFTVLLYRCVLLRVSCDGVWRLSCWFCSVLPIFSNLILDSNWESRREKEDKERRRA